MQFTIIKTKKEPCFIKYLYLKLAFLLLFLLNNLLQEKSHLKQRWLLIILFIIFIYSKDRANPIDNGYSSGPLLLSNIEVK
jgi:hypothetical protein